jgi:hypothetical protein
MASELQISDSQAALVLGVVGTVLGTAVLCLLPSQAGLASHAAALDPSGPGFFPLLAGTVTLLAGLGCLVNARSRGEPGQGGAASFETLHWRRGGLVTLWLLAAGMGLHTVGMLTTLGILTSGLAVVFGERRLPWLLGLGIVTPVAIYLLFEVVLKILFPRGWLL